MLLKISAILLAAGLSQRMGCDKLLLEYHGKTLLQRSIELLSSLPVFEHIIIMSDTRNEIITLPSGIRSLINHIPENGISGSIRVGIEAATGTHYFFLTADQPLLTVADLIPLLESSEADPDKIVFPVIDSKPCSPTIFPGHFRTELLDLSGDTGGRAVRDANTGAWHTVEPERPFNFVDIDSAEDYQALGIND